MSYFRALPDELKVVILTQVSLKDLVDHCCLVCKDWFRLINDPMIWEERLVREGIIKKEWGLSKVYLTGLEWLQLGVVSPFTGNLLRNPNMDNGCTKYWTVEGSYNNGGAGPRQTVAWGFKNKKGVDFERSQKLQLSRIPKIMALLERFDVYLKSTVFITLSAGSFQSCIASDDSIIIWNNHKHMLCKISTVHCEPFAPVAIYEEKVTSSFLPKIECSSIGYYSYNEFARPRIEMRNPRPGLQNEIYNPLLQLHIKK